jgi:RNA recognition motif-containing protein
MSYDYNALVEAIQSSRRKALDTADSAAKDRLEHVQTAVQTFETLSSHCPMTPLLWMHYAETAAQLILECNNTTNIRDNTSDESTTLAEQEASAAAMKCDLLELGLQEFPGSVVLHLYRIECLQQLQCNESNPTAKEELRVAFQTALDNVAIGSHYNEDEWVDDIFRRLVESESDPQAKASWFLQRASVPMKQANQSLVAEINQVLSSEHDLLHETLSHVDVALRSVAQQFAGFIATYEDSIDMAMHQEGILARHELIRTSDGAMHWSKLMFPGDQTYLMGLGGQATANAFIQYAMAMQKLIRTKQKDEASSGVDVPETLPMAIYERGVAECPGVETIWSSYVRHLVELIQYGKGQQCVDVAQRLRSVAQRAVRNCPYSLKLVQEQLHSAFWLARVGLEVVDPDLLLQACEREIHGKFLPLPGQFLEIYLTAIRVVKRRILYLLTPPNITKPDKKVEVVEYDESEPIAKSKNGFTLASRTVVADESLDEAMDLLDDLNEMYEEVDKRLVKAHKNWSEGRAVLWREKAQTKTIMLVGPLGFDKDGNKIGRTNTSQKEDQPLYWFEKAMRTHNPPHPDSCAAYIRSFITDAPVATAADVAKRIRQGRFLFEKALETAERPKDSKLTPLLAQEYFRDYDVALANLANEWLDFERIVGSSRSIGRAVKTIQAKLRKAQSKVPASKSGSATTLISKAPYEEDELVEYASKRHRQEESTEDRPAKKIKSSLEGNGTECELQNETKVASPENPLVVHHKVKVGHLEYPAHPYTVRVSFLSPKTEDMDLVDLFRAKCGAVVHARIMRDKHQHGRTAKSKGWGLVQFEERNAVEAALALDDVIGLHEKVLRIDRSHIPAVALVPPGMHRIKEKGEGKYSNRNEKRHKPSADSHGDSHRDAEPTIDAAKLKEASSSSATTAHNVLAFRPRAVAKKVHQKPRLNLDNKQPSPR